MIGQVFDTMIVLTKWLFSTLLWEVFLRVLLFSPLPKNQHFQIPIRSLNARTFLNKFFSVNSLVLRGQRNYVYIYIYMYICITSTGKEGL